MFCTSAGGGRCSLPQSGAAEEVAEQKEFEDVTTYVRCVTYTVSYITVYLHYIRYSSCDYITVCYIQQLCCKE